MKKILAVVLAAVLLGVGALMLTGCGNQLAKDTKSIQGTWETEDSSRQYIITATQIRMVGADFGYKLSAGNKITITYQTQTEQAKYTLSKDGKTLSIVETVQSGTTTSTAQAQTNTLKLKKVSDKTSGEPQSKSSTGSSSSSSGSSAGNSSSK